MELYKISEQFSELNRLAQDGLIDKQTLEDTLEQVQADFETKAEAIIYIKKSLEARIAAFDAETARMDYISEQLGKQVNSLVDYLRDNMARINCDKIELPLFNITLKKPTKAVNIIDELKVPDSFWVTVPESKRVDKNLLSAALKVGEVEGAELVDGKRALIIK